MDPFSLPPLSTVLDGAYAMLMALASLLQPIAFDASAALAVVIVTLVVRALLVPTGIAQAKAEQARARLAPRLQALQRRYKNDRDRLARETMKLYANEKASPFAGCLPVVIQLPIVGVLYALFLHTVIDGHPNGLLTEQLLGVPLGASLVGSVGGGTATLPLVAVLGAVILLIALVGELTRRMLRHASVGDTGVPGGETLVRLTGILHFGTAVAAAFVPLAAGLYLLVTVSWTLAQRVILRKRYPVVTPGG
jgi:YidC/Oxa1 family membrane protein insertase